TPIASRSDSRPDRPVRRSHDRASALASATPPRRASPRVASNSRRRPRRCSARTSVPATRIAGQVLVGAEPSGPCPARLEQNPLRAAPDPATHVPAYADTDPPPSHRSAHGLEKSFMNVPSDTSNKRRQRSRRALLGIVVGGLAALPGLGAA